MTRITVWGVFRGGIFLTCKSFKISVLLIEHDMKLVMGICERITVLNFGQLLAQGLPAEIQSNKEVIKAYIGE